MNLLKYLILFFVIGNGEAVRADVQSSKSQTSLGQLKVSDILIEPIFLLEESQESRFDFQHSFVAVDWSYDQDTKISFSIGQKSLLATPARFGAQNNDSDELTFVDLNGRFSGDYGSVILGLQPIPFGYTGGGHEARLEFSPSLIYQFRRVGRRDIGLGYEISHNHFYNKLLVHNGESGKELDNRFWLTGQWGWLRADGKLDVGVSLSGGKTSPVSTAQVSNPSSETLFDGNENADWKMGVFHLMHKGRLWGGLLQGYSGQVQQDNNGRNEFYGGHLDLLYFWNKNISFGLRYDYLDPDANRDNDEEEQVVIVLSLHNKYQTSRFFIEGRQNLPSSSNQQDQILFLWRLTSLSNPFFPF